MRRLPHLSGKQIGAALEREGFIFQRQRGSHLIYRKEAESGARSVTVPNHREVKRSTLQSILAQARLSQEDFLKLL